MSWQQRLTELNARNGKVVLAHLFPASGAAGSFEQSKLKLILEDQMGPGRLASDDGLFGYIPQIAGAGRLGAARNQAVKKFLEHTTAEWLLFVDSDMGFEPDLIERLLSAADPEERPVVGGLCFAQRFYGIGPGEAVRTLWQPTLYTRVTYGDGKVSWDPAYNYSSDAVVKVDGSGAACVLIHRTVLERIDGGWFTPLVIGEGPEHAGEDISFFERLYGLGVPVYVNTAAKTSHMKEQWFTEADYTDLRSPASSAVTVVIPVKDNLEQTRTLVGQLHEQGGYSDLLIFDNGSTDPAMVEWLDGQGVAEVFDAKDADGIHVMWNAGITEALNRHRGLADVVFLNNDVSVGHRFLRRLISGLRSQPLLMAASGNYDKRPGTGVQPVHGICANRYDGTGGLAGFAFALRAEWIASGFRFDETMKWWYGDNDLCLELEKAGAWYGVVTDAVCEHVHGGSQTATPDGWAEIVAADREAFEAKWPHVKLAAA